jgi:hypothetical protein
MTDKWRFLRESVLAQFGPELAAGRHQEYPALRLMWIEAETERAENDALVQACWEVAHGADNRMEN